MPKRFVATENAAHDGFSSTKPAAGAKMVQDWIDELEKAEFTGEKGLHDDLTRLQKELSVDSPDSEKVKSLLGKLGTATVKASKKCEDAPIAEKLLSLGEALTQSAK